MRLSVNIASRLPVIRLRKHRECRPVDLASASRGRTTGNFRNNGVLFPS